MNPSHKMTEPPHQPISQLNQSVSFVGLFSSLENSGTWKCSQPGMLHERGIVILSVVHKFSYSLNLCKEYLIRRHAKQQPNCRKNVLL